MLTDHEEDAAEPTTTAFDTAIITPNVARSASVSMANVGLQGDQLFETPPSAHDVRAGRSVLFGRFRPASLLCCRSQYLALVIMLWLCPSSEKGGAAARGRVCARRARTRALRCGHPLWATCRAAWSEGLMGAGAPMVLSGPGRRRTDASFVSPTLRQQQQRDWIRPTARLGNCYKYAPRTGGRGSSPSLGRSA